MNLILTGATGYLGSHLTRAFLQDGHRVIALKRQSSDMHRIVDISANIIFYDLDNLDFAKPFTDQGPIDAVIHTATSYGRAGESTTQVNNANTVFPLRLLETAILFNTDTFFNTDTILNPYVNAYAMSKKHFVDWGHQLAANDCIRFFNIRLEHLYGPGEEATNFISWLVASCLRNDPIIELTLGKQRLDFIYIDDAVSAYQLLLKNTRDLGHGFKEISVGCGDTVTIRTLTEMVHRLTRSTSELSFGALSYRQNETMESQADIEKLKTLGWYSKTSLSDGIKKTIENFSNNQ